MFVVANVVVLMLTVLTLLFVIEHHMKNNYKSFHACMCARYTRAHVILGNYYKNDTTL